MKKMFLFMVPLLCVLTLAGCMNTDSMQTTEIGSTEINTSTVQTNKMNSVATVEHETVYIADAAMYRGTVLNSQKTLDGTVIALAQAVGTNFGTKTMTFLITSSTIGYTDILEGTYIEVFYGKPLRGNFDYTATQNAIGINNLGIAEMVNFNGTILSIKKNGETITSLTMRDMQNGKKVVFNVSKDTQMYLAESDIKQGNTLNIYHKGMYTFSLPPQGVALEIQYMAENYSVD